MEKEIPNVVPTVINNQVPAETGKETLETDGKNDPLDQLEDIEEIRREAKKYRGIASRIERKSEGAAVVPAIPDSPYITREEIYEKNRKEALAELSEFDEADPEVDIKKEIDANWNDIVKYYVARNGQNTPEDILQDIYDAHTVWKRRHGGSTADDSARTLQTSTVISPSGGQEKVKETNLDSRFTKGKSPAEWYKKKD